MLSFKELLNIWSSGGLIINPRNRWYRTWEKFILLWAIYSSFFTPMEFGFFRGLPDHVYLLDILGQVVFFVDVFLLFFVAYRDIERERLNQKSIAWRYLTTYFIFDLLSCMPWDIIYRVSGRKEEVRYLLLIRLVRVRKVLEFFRKLETDIRVNYFFSRILKLVTIELYCTHTAACIFYYLATTLPASQEEYTWIGSLKLGAYSYSNFRDIDLWKKYITSLYFAVITMATVGYGDIHAVNTREMIFVMVYVSFDMVLGAYLVGNITALVVKGSKTEIYRDRIKSLLKYVDKKTVRKEIHHKIKEQLLLPNDRSHSDPAVFQDLPTSVRTTIAEHLYKPQLKEVPLFKGCSPEFINQIVTRVHEEFYPPGKVIMEQGSVVDKLYFIYDGKLEEVIVNESGHEETVSNLKPQDSFGDVSILHNKLQPYTVRVLDRCLLLRIDKKSFSNILKIYLHDKEKILVNLEKEAKTRQSLELSSCFQEPSVTEKVTQKRCTVYPFQPWEESKDQNKYGVVLRVPDTIDELMKTAAEYLKLDLLPTSCIITKEKGQIVNVDIIKDEEKLYLIATQA